MLVKAVFDQLTHPRLHRTAPVRRGFGDPVRGEQPSPTPVQRGSATRPKGLVQLLRAGASVDPTRLLNVQETIGPTHRERQARSATAEGSGAIEGHPDRIPLVDIRTGLCEGTCPFLFDADGACLDLGRDERLFTDKQKAVLAVRDGGCLDPDCTRPPSWTEAHHIDHWQRDGGRTDLADGILLCRRDHLRYHNQGWEVRRTGTNYWLIPPAGVDPEQTPRLMRAEDSRPTSSIRSIRPDSRTLTMPDPRIPSDSAQLDPGSVRARPAEPERVLSVAG